MSNILSSEMPYWRKRCIEEINRFSYHDYVLIDPEDNKKLSAQGWQAVHNIVNLFGIKPEDQVTHGVSAFCFMNDNYVVRVASEYPAFTRVTAASYDFPLVLPSLWRGIVQNENNIGSIPTFEEQIVVHVTPRVPIATGFSKHWGSPDMHSLNA